MHYQCACCRGCSAVDALDGVLTPYVQACSTSTNKWVSQLPYPSSSYVTAVHCCIDCHWVCNSLVSIACSWSDLIKLCCASACGEYGNAIQLQTLRQARNLNPCICVVVLSCTAWSGSSTAPELFRAGIFSAQPASMPAVTT